MNPVNNTAFKGSSVPITQAARTDITIESHSGLFSFKTSKNETSGGLSCDVVFFCLFSDLAVIKKSVCQAEFGYENKERTFSVDFCRTYKLKVGILSFLGNHFFIISRSDKNMLSTGSNFSIRILRSL